MPNKAIEDILKRLNIVEKLLGEVCTEIKWLTRILAIVAGVGSVAKLLSLM